VVPAQGVLRLNQMLQEGLDLLQRCPAQPRVLQRLRVQGADAPARGAAPGDATGGKYFQKNRKFDSKRTDNNMKHNWLTFF